MSDTQNLKVVGGPYDGEQIGLHGVDRIQLSPRKRMASIAYNPRAEMATEQVEVAEYSVRNVRTTAGDVSFLAPVGWTVQQALQHLIDAHAPPKDSQS